MKPLDQLSLGWRTDLIFARFDAELIQRPDYLVVRTPHNPTYWWGNFLLFDHPPALGEGARWLDCFDTEIASRETESRHVSLGVDSAEAFELPADLVDAGLECNPGTVLTMRRDQLITLPSPLAAGFRIARLDLAIHADAAVELQVASDMGVHGDVESYRTFRARQMQRYHAMSQAGLGDWFGVFTGEPGNEQLVSDCGLFRESIQDARSDVRSDAGIRKLGRFQFVSTHPQWRRRGLCRALIHAVCLRGFDTMKLDELVIIADPHDVAIVLYEALGFRRGVTQWHIERKAADSVSG